LDYYVHRCGDFALTDLDSSAAYPQMVAGSHSGQEGRSADDTTPEACYSAALGSAAAVAVVLPVAIAVLPVAGCSTAPPRKAQP